MKSSSKQVFTTRGIKPKHAKNIHIKACKLNGSLEIVTKLYELAKQSVSLSNFGVWASSNDCAEMEPCFPK